MAIFSFGCNADLTSKHWAAESLKNQSPVEVVPKWVEFIYVENPAVSFGLLRQIPASVRIPLIFTITIATVFVLLGIGWYRRKNKLADLLPLTLIASGAIGNILDRMHNGFVIDFIHFHYSYQYSFPVFNIADTLVFCGVCLFLYQNWQKTKTAIPENFS